ncbi:universal stress protein [Pseudonocardia bannensis]|uniref:Universal stress protein n=1 Tax=Pseudonocardia bannensis TaxID=630973 RepID=A0A848DJ64_9PSEU|nr:universal stress protein [Pseudonocardia bannensis]NMH92576.1 universal stress protein [Pseudonocardia bannensis]
MRSGPVLIGFDGTPAAERALREAGELLAPRHALVVVVMEIGRVFAATVGPLMTASIPVTETEIRTAMEYEKEALQAARRLAEKGAAMAQEAGFDAQGLVVADDASVPATLLRLAEERDAPVLVLGAHRHSALSELLMGSTARELLKRADRPVLVVREGEVKTD